MPLSQLNEKCLAQRGDHLERALNRIGIRVRLSDNALNGKSGWSSGVAIAVDHRKRLNPNVRAIDIEIHDLRVGQ